MDTISEQEEIEGIAFDLKFKHLIKWGTMALVILLYSQTLLTISMKMKEETEGYLGYYFVLSGVITGFVVNHNREEKPSVEIPTG